ncbi:ATP-binding domain-containing protein [Streptacidiphilus sp. N1-3]|uniref:ATP-binding domain-containing protein n=1 Tax=Streptacidiphilus alkalitolerans TaxID=3342712 RepID=A0ABV6X6R9_9ACTN
MSVEPTPTTDTHAQAAGPEAPTDAQTAAPAAAEAAPVAAAPPTAAELAQAMRAIDGGTGTIVTRRRPAPPVADPDSNDAAPDGAQPDAATADDGAEPAPAAAAPPTSEQPAADAGAATADARPVPTPRPAPAPGGPSSAEPSADALRATAEVLAAGGAPAELVAATVATLGEGAPALLREDPWAVLGVPGVRPEHADGFARGLLGAACGPDDPRRAQALAVWLLSRAALRGHTAVELGDISTGLEKQGVTDPTGAIALMLGEGGDGSVMGFQEELQEPGAHRAASEDDEDEEPQVRVLLALDRLALAEDSLADGLVRLISTFEGDPAPAPAPDASEADTESDTEAASEAASDDDAPVLDWAAAADAAPSPSAAALIRAVADAGLVLHTGGEAARAEPVALVRAARGLGLRAWVAAATADGRRRLADQHAVTLAGLLAGAEGPGRSSDGTLALDLLVVCDSPALDVDAAATLVESVADGARLVLSGDPAELWSAGPGRVFADVLAAKACPVVASRTPDFGPIGELASGVGVGELLPVEAPDKEVVIVTAKDGPEAVHRALQLVGDSIPRALGIPAEQVRVLTPGHGGPAGTRALNAALKQRFNPGPGTFGGFDAGDAVVHSPVPGTARPGTVRAGGPQGLLLDCEGEEVRVPREQVGTVRHGWALTAHQAVGRRWPGVVVLLAPDAASELTRQWVYTAFSRAERHLSVVHAVGPALVQAVAAVPAQGRTTRLRGALVEQTADLRD